MSTIKIINKNQNKMKNQIKTIALCILTLTQISVFAQDEEPCKLILQNGLYKTYQMAKTGNFTQDLKYYFSSVQFKRDFRNNKWGGFLSVIVDAVPIELGISSSDVQISEFQSKIRQATSLTITQSFYDYAYSNLPDVDLAKAYTDCIAIRKFGFKVNASVSDSDVLFIVSYYKEVDSDPMPKVLRFEVSNGTNITKSFNNGDFLKNQTSISCDRDPDKDLTLVLETDRGVASYKVYADPSGFNKDLPTGTIIASYLNWTEFQVATKNNTSNPAGNLWSSRYSKWAPADGRQVPNSSFQRITNQNNVPDLRGMFLRGLNQFDVEYPAITDNERKDPDTRSRGNLQSDDFKSHNHDASGKITGNVTGSNGTNDVDEGSKKKNSDPMFPDKDVYVKVEYRGGAETRPKNIAIFYYIRIN